MSSLCSTHRIQLSVSQWLYKSRYCLGCCAYTCLMLNCICVRPVLLCIQLSYAELHSFEDCCVVLPSAASTTLVYSQPFACAMLRTQTSCTCVCHRPCGASTLLATYDSEGPELYLIEPVGIALVRVKCLKSFAHSLYAELE